MNREEARKKAQELVDQMTVEEKACQLRYDAPAIKRLGIPAYNWWNEGLHGVARAGQATVFPQAIGLGATFDPELVGEVPYYFIKTGDCTWSTYLLQRRLIELGYLAEGSADGVFGSGTAAALSAFQAKLGLAATGAADVITQEKIYARTAPRVDE